MSASVLTSAQTLMSASPLVSAQAATSAGAYALASASVLGFPRTLASSSSPPVPPCRAQPNSEPSTELRSELTSGAAGLGGRFFAVVRPLAGTRLTARLLVEPRGSRDSARTTVPFAAAATAAFRAAVAVFFAGAFFLALLFWGAAKASSGHAVAVMVGLAFSFGNNAAVANDLLPGPGFWLLPVGKPPRPLSPRRGTPAPAAGPRGKSAATFDDDEKRELWLASLRGRGCPAHRVKAGRGDKQRARTALACYRAGTQETATRPRTPPRSHRQAALKAPDFHCESRWSPISGERIHGAQHRGLTFCSTKTGNLRNIRARQKFAHERQGQCTYLIHPTGVKSKIIIKIQFDMLRGDATRRGSCTYNHLVNALFEELASAHGNVTVNDAPSREMSNTSANLRESLATLHLLFKGELETALRLLDFSSGGTNDPWSLIRHALLFPNVTEH
ncbi:MAG: hypothetical protein BJ554DRAFT_6683 [Olpidium bornovanus]|uniref:Uncharacterized protein n=1 Tax=Olpidium bornovanus TaxID=278681 RepID=A0A8H8DKI9_9FUNG|nr:MAG: hypothetical protein BJ554DRAFT_6683 [Olpidium bornovanus]